MRRHDPAGPERPRAVGRLRALMILSLPLHAALLGLLPGDGQWVEAVYARHVYPALAPVVTFLPRLVPISLAVGLAVALLLWIPAGLLVNLIRWRRRRTGLGRALGRTAAGWAVMAAVVFHLFFLCWGYNYLRPPLEARLGLRATARPEDLTETAVAIVEAAGAAHLPVPPWDAGELDRLLDRALDRAVRRLEGRSPAVRGPLKRAWPPGLLAAFGTLGVICPWTLEAHADFALPPAWLAFTAAHEKAHAAGFAPEREASFVAWLALTASPDARLRYAGHLGVVEHFLVTPAVRRRLSPAVRHDLEALREYRRRHVSTVLEEGGRRVYSLYLEANRVAGGVADYARVARLIHAWRQREGGGGPDPAGAQLRARGCR